MDLIIINLIWLTTFYSTLHASVHHHQHQQQQQQQPTTGNYYSNQYAVRHQNRAHLSHIVAQKGGITYGRLSGSRSANYGLQDNLNGYTYGSPQAQIPVLMVPIVPDFRLIYQAPVSYFNGPITQQRYTNHQQQQQQLGPIYSSFQTNAPRYSSNYNEQLVSMLYGRPKSTIIRENNDSQYDISLK